MEFEDTTATLNAARDAAEKAKVAALARLDALEGERVEYLKGYAAEKARIKEALRTRPFQAKPRKPKAAEVSNAA